jgi:hypothetical protein
LKGLFNEQESYAGQGAIDIREGRLWQTSLFKQMGDLVFVKVEGLDVVLFRSLSGTFVIDNKKLWTDDLSVFGDTVDLSLKGAIGFDQTLDLLMNIRFSADILRGAVDTGGLVPLVVQQASAFISQYRITGTFSKPSYEKIGKVEADAAVRRVADLLASKAFGA